MFFAIITIYMYVLNEIFFYKRIIRIFLSKLNQKLMEGQVLEIRFLKALFTK